MRRVYNPPRKSSNPILPILGAGLLTLAVFLVLPLTQMVSSGMKRELMVRKISDAQLEAPPEEIEPPPPPPEEKVEEPPPPPALTDAPPPMHLNVDLDVAMGSGGALAGFGMFGGAADSAGSALDTFDVSDLERRPEIVSSVPPQYPPELRKAKVEGAVTLVFVLDETGRVEDLRVENSSRAEFEKPALDAVRRWKFRPGMKDGEPVRTYMKLPIRFRFNS
jgi:periplasmic protein TonB